MSFDPKLLEIELGQPMPEAAEAIGSVRKFLAHCLELLRHITEHGRVSMPWLLGKWLPNLIKLAESVAKEHREAVAERAELEALREENERLRGKNRLGPVVPGGIAPRG